LIIITSVSCSAFSNPSIEQICYRPGGWIAKKDKGTLKNCVFMRDQVGQNIGNKGTSKNSFLSVPLIANIYDKNGFSH
jgi:hypothetical protein